MMIMGLLLVVEDLSRWHPNDSGEGESDIGNNDKAPGHQGARPHGPRDPRGSHRSEGFPRTHGASEPCHHELACQMLNLFQQRMMIMLKVIYAQ